MPYILRLLIVLAVILILNRALKNLMLSILTGVVVLVLFLEIPIVKSFKIAYDVVIDSNTLLLCVTVFLIIMFSNFMDQAGIMKNLVSFFKIHLSKKWAMAALPAVIGLLPMPGGAVFSAPLVEECDVEKEISGTHKSAVNYWFRHVWEPWWPLYPGVLLAVELSGISITDFIKQHIAMSIFAIIGGYFFLLRKIESDDSAATLNKKEVSSEHNLLFFLKVIAPVSIVVLVFISMKLFYKNVDSISNYIPVIAGIITSTIYILLRYKPGIPIIIKKTMTKKNFSLILLVLIISIYGKYIQTPIAENMTIMSFIKDELLQYSLSPVIVVIMIPFISGLAMGISVGFVGASFPIVAGLISGDMPGGLKLSYIALAWGAGYTGMIISPVHVCVIVSSKYFQSSVEKSLLKVIMPALTVFIGALFISVLLRYY